MIAFKTWVKQLKDFKNPLGDLARDVISDKDFPKSRDKNKVVNYLLSKNPCHEALEAFNKAWDDYKSKSIIG